MLCGNLLAALFCYLKEAYKKTGEGPFTRTHSDRKGIMAVNQKREGLAWMRYWPHLYW